MIRFRSRIDEHQNFDGPHALEDYLTSHGGFGDWLTQVVTRLNAANGGAYPGADAKPPVPAAFPWITPVLGSGCVDTDLLDQGAALRVRLAKIQGLLDEEGPLADNTARGPMVVKFAERLIRDRVDPKWSPLATSETDDGMPLIDNAHAAAHLLLAAALLTRLHHEVNADHWEPVPRWDDDEALEIQRGPRTAEVEVVLVQPALAALEAAATALPRNSPIRDLINRRMNELDQRRIASLPSLRLLTECAWELLVYDCRVQPGWSELMLQLTLSTPPPINHQHGHARPVYNVVSRAASKLGAIYRGIAKESWEARLSMGADRIRGLHDQVAEVLGLQASLHGRNLGVARVPLASAFVTGFDLELELALVAAGQAFVMAVPVFIEGLSDDEVAIVWLGKLVEPAAGEDGYARALLDEGPWLLLSGMPQFGRTNESYGGLPVIVRLTGCPALRLPDLQADTELRTALRNLLEPNAGAADGWTPVLHPVLVLDEYVASVLGTAETFLDHVDLARLGLPRWITGTPGGVNALYSRFWLILGVQMGDSSIRQRLVSQLASPKLSSPVPDAQSRPKRSGLVVGRRIEPLDGRLMQWQGQGFDIVHGSCGQLVDHLDHYAAHLEQVDQRCDPDSPCQVQRLL